MVTIDTARLRELAMKATPGEWHVLSAPWRGPYDDPKVIAGHTDPHIAKYVCECVCPEDWDEDDEKESDRAEYDARYIAALSPAVVMELLDRLEKAEAKP